MNTARNLVSAFTLSAFLFAGASAFAQDHHDDQHTTYVKHDEWHKGAKIQQEDWNRGQQVDWHAHHLRQPPRGYEWREVDGNYVLAAVATGVIASAIIAAGH